MKLRTGRAIYKIPDHSQIFSVWIEGNMPHNENKIEFYPTPDKPYKVRGRYAPPIKEF